MHFELSGKKIRLLAVAVMVFIICFVAWHWKLYLDPDLELKYGKVLFVLSMLGGVAACPLICVRSRVDDKYKMFANTALFFILPFFTIQMVECLNGNFIWNFSVQTGLANYMIYLVFYLFFYLITGRYHMTGLIVNISLYVWCLLNYFVEQFRGTPFIPMDILSAKTGLSVSDGYTYALSWQIILGSIIFFLIYLINKRSVNMKPKKLKFKILSKSAVIGYLAIVVLSFFFTDFSTNMGYKPDFWNQTRGYHNTGSFFNFCLNTKYLVVRRPSGYTAKDVNTYIDEALEEAGVDPEGDTSINLLTGKNDYKPNTKKMPHIICIMNESLSDLTHLGNLETNEDPLANLKSMDLNTIKGYVSIPVFGAGTSNSEFEFLTGETISFLPAGCNVYQSYISSEVPSLVSTLRSLGYSRTAYHPYYGSGWNRPFVYPALGFEEFTAIEDFIDSDILEQYKSDNDAEAYADNLKERYPDKDMLLRRFVSDSYDYTMVKEMFENRNPDEPFFLFNVTMQNHGGYAMSYSNFFQDVYATNTSTSYPMANRYLSLVKQSDLAFKELTDYFKKVNEPVIICMFGDHYPSIEDDFYAELLGSDTDKLSLEQEQLRYETPFVIWANYNIPEADVDHISANYLSTLLMQTARLPMTQYNKYLAALYQKLPVIDSVGYMDSEGNMYASGAESEYTDDLHKYNCIEYNALLDKFERQDELFYLAEEE